MSSTDRHYAGRLLQHGQLGLREEPEHHGRQLARNAARHPPTADDAVGGTAAVLSPRPEFALPEPRAVGGRQVQLVALPHPEDVVEPRSDPARKPRNCSKRQRVLARAAADTKSATVSPVHGGAGEAPCNAPVTRV